MGDYSEMVKTGSDGKIDTQTCMIMGELLKEKTAELDALNEDDTVDISVVVEKETEVSAIREVYAACEHGEEDATTEKQ